MGEPTDEAVLEGGPWGNPNVHFNVTGARLALPAPISAFYPQADQSVDVVYYADSGRRTAEGRRVFVPEGSP
jgi:hypothetical protein